MPNLNIQSPPQSQGSTIHRWTGPTDQEVDHHAKPKKGKKENPQIKTSKSKNIQRGEVKSKNFS
jgi:hypothetical protein